MRLFIGIIVFLAWSAGSGYWYVCKIKGLCPEAVAPATAIASTTPVPTDTLTELPPQELDTVPFSDNAASLKAIPEALAGTRSLLFSFAKPIMQNRDEFESYIAEAAAFLLAHARHKVSITGYTDDTAARHNNLKLGLRRAEAVADMFREAGVDDGQMLIASRGEENPVASNETRAGRKQNRRVEIELIAP